MSIICYKCKERFEGWPASCPDCGTDLSEEPYLSPLWARPSEAELREERKQLKKSAERRLLQQSRQEAIDRSDAKEAERKLAFDQAWNSEEAIAARELLRQQREESEALRERQRLRDEEQKQRIDAADAAARALQSKQEQRDALATKIGCWALVIIAFGIMGGLS